MCGFINDKGCYQDILAVRVVLGVQRRHWCHQCSEHRFRLCHLEIQQILVITDFYVGLNMLLGPVCEPPTTDHNGTFFLQFYTFCNKTADSLCLGHSHPWCPSLLDNLSLLARRDVRALPRDSFLEVRGVLVDPAHRGHLNVPAGLAEKLLTRPPLLSDLFHLGNLEHRADHHHRYLQRKVRN